MERITTFLSRNSFISCLGSFLLGVSIASLVDIQSVYWYAVLIIVLVLLGVSYVLRDEQKQKVFRIGIVCIVICTAGAFRYAMHTVTQRSVNLESLVGQKVELTVFVTNPGQDKGSYTSYVVTPEHSNEKVLVHASLYPEFQYGDSVIFSGKLEKPKNFKTESNKEFDYVTYLKKDGIFYTMPFAQGVLVSHGNGNTIEQLLFSIKNKFLNNIQEMIVEPESSLLAGILLGVDSLSREIQEQFRITGIVHIVVLSGYNITIVSESLVRFFSFLPKQVALGGGALGIVLFSIMVGGTPSVLRASLMALLVLLARSSGRRYDIGRALLLAACVMVAWSPSILVFDISFQLSFLSTVALIWISPLFYERLTFVSEKYGLREITSATLSTQLFVLPLLLYKIGQFSIVGLPVNILVLGVVPALMLSGFLTGLFGFVSHALSIPFGFVSFWLLAYILKVADLFARLPFAAVHIESFSVWMFWITYSVYGILFWKLQKKKRIV